MKLKLWNAVGLAACAVLLAIAAPVSAKAATTAEKSATAMAAKGVREAWPAETLSGTIMAVDPAQNLVIVKGADGVPFDMDVRASTRIRSGDHRLTLKDLASEQKKNVTVHFVPERAGDIARTIQVNG
ncbi:MAG TPA: hypothetical protein VMH80_01780 [Bryobacteraceae bacterium]|nr:hypothetical protein [Bryobacteraceae bacterium]